MTTQQNRFWFGGMLFGVSALFASDVSAVTGTAGRFSGTRAVVNQCSITTAFTTIPGMVQTFVLGGTANDEVVVTFQASLVGRGRAVRYGIRPVDGRRRGAAN